MTWLAWRQFRTQAAAALGVVALFAILLAITRPHLASLYASSGVSGCHGSSCGQLAANFLNGLTGTSIYAVVDLGLIGVILAPAIIGIFWGAPLLARELESGTLGLAWTQSISRTRWLAIKLALIGLSAMAVTEGLSLLFSWWAAPIVHAARLATGITPIGSPFSSKAFDALGITPLGYAAFAVALGVTAGLLIRRAIPAMAVTLVIFAVFQIAFPQVVRSHLLPADHTSIAISPGVTVNRGGGSKADPTTVAFSVQHLPGQPGAWILSNQGVNASGQPVSAIPAACRQSASSALSSFSSDFRGCLTSSGMRIAVTYQPASRYWPFQWIETAIYVALALALAEYCFWRTRRRSRGRPAPSTAPRPLLRV
jgi:hypothetical protein